MNYENEIETIEIESKIKMSEMRKLLKDVSEINKSLKEILKNQNTIQCKPNDIKRKYKYEDEDDESTLIIDTSPKKKLKNNYEELKLVNIGINDNVPLTYFEKDDEGRYTRNIKYGVAVKDLDELLLYKFNNKKYSFIESKGWVKLEINLGKESIIENNINNDKSIEF